MSKNLTLHIDGAITKNPGGLGTYGWVLRNGHNVVREGMQKVPAASTSNEAEYLGLINGLKWVMESDFAEKRLTVYSDSQLVVKQMTGQYRVKAGNLRTLRNRVFDIMKEMVGVEFIWIPREENEYADQLSKQARYQMFD